MDNNINEEERKLIERELEFIEKLDLDQLKYEISSELGELTDQAGNILDSAERKREVIPPEMEVRITPNRLEAYLKVITPGKPVPITENDILNCLKEHDISARILMDSVEQVLVEKLVGQEVLIVRGVVPINGTDGYIRLLRDSVSQTPEDCVDVRGRVDFKKMRQSNIVEAGEIIAEIIPPTPGEDGYDVTGNKIKPRPGKEVDFSLTPDVGTLPDDKLKLMALKNGVLKKDFTIDEINFINGDVDYSTGNIDYPKSLVIKGDVKSGFSIHCGEHIEVRGCVEDAEVLAEGDVIVKQGFIGTGKGLIKGRNVTIGHIKQQTVIASGDITVGGEVMHGELRAGGFIKMIGVRGIVIGGALIATKGIEVLNVGNAQHVKTTLQVGYNQEIMDIDRRQERLKINIEKVESALRIYKAARSVKELSGNREQTLERLLGTRNYLIADKEKLETLRIATIENLLRQENPYIKVVQNVFPNTTIQIGHLKNYVTAELRNKRFCYHNNKIFTGI